MKAVGKDGKVIVVEYSPDNAKRGLKNSNSPITLSLPMQQSPWKCMIK